MHTSVFTVYVHNHRFLSSSVSGPMSSSLLGCVLTQANDIDFGENKTVRYEFIHSFPHEPYFWINSTTGVIRTAGAFVWQIGDRFDFDVRAYDRNKQPENVVQDNEGWRYTNVPISVSATIFHLMHPPCLTILPYS